MLIHEECSIPFDGVDVIVVGLHLRWNGVWQRPNHLLHRFGADVPVIVLEEPLLDGSNSDVTECFGGVTVVTPHRVAVSDAVDRAALDTVRKLVAGRRPLVWLYTPMMLAIADAFPRAPLVFDKMDELASFAKADARLAAREATLVATADLVFTGGRSLFRSVEQRATRARCYPSGVDVEHFAQARRVEPHAALAAFEGPVMGYIGVIDERLDLELIAALADAYPSATVALVGPVVKIDPAVLPRRANIAYLGQRPYSELPSLLAGIDVALMPFALNAHTESISPTKTLEYLAAGRPVVSTAVRDVVEDHGDVVSVACDTADFIALAGRALERDEARASRAEGKLRQSSWEGIVDAMRRDLREIGISVNGTAHETPRSDMRPPA